MRNIKLTIEYDGTGFAGWQAQKAQRTVQETIEKALRRILGEKVSLIASGRTDSGVHALAQVANFKTNSALTCESVKNALNSNLPQDIAIKDCRQVPLDFHARFDAKAKTYRYTIYNGKSRTAISRHYVARIPYGLDIDLMRKEARALIGRKNFKSFHAGASKADDFVRHVRQINISKGRNNFIYIDISANGFLYNMARNIVGTLVEIGRGKMAPGSARRILNARNRRLAGPTAPAKGLCLVEVKY